jgi:hypothetical protein
MHPLPIPPSVVSDLANGGQVLLDAETFERVKGDRALSAVDQHGYNDALIASRAARGPLAALLCCRRMLVPKMGTVLGGLSTAGCLALPARRHGLPWTSRRLP